MDLLNAENVDPSEVNTAAMEEQLFNHPDPYNLDETDSPRISDTLQIWSQTIVRSRVRFDITDYVKLGDSMLNDLISNMDSDGPGASVTTTQQNKVTGNFGKPGGWTADSFL